MLRKSILCSALLLIAFSSVAVAEPVPFTLTGELRVRNENDNRDFNSDTSFKSFNLMRTRLGIDVRPTSDMQVFVQVQDSRVAGLEGPSTIPGVQEESTLDLHQGFFQVNNLGWDGLGLKAGRTEVRWGNERLLGATDWSNVPTAFDGAMLSVGGSRVSVQALYANLVERDTPVIGSPDTENSDATLQAGFGSFVVSDRTTAELQLINVMDKVSPSDDDDLNVFTVGGRVYGAMAQRFDYNVEGAWQTGTVETGPSLQQDVGAYMFGGEVGMALGSQDRPVRIGAGYDYLSGDKDATDADNGAFNTLFGDNHTFYGSMDVVQVASVGAPGAGQGGLQDLKFNVNGTVWQNASNNLRLGGEFHNFRLAQAGSGASDLGNEIDVHATWAYRERFVPTLGVSAFLPGDAVAGPTPTTDADNSYWVYLQGVVSF